MTQQQQPAPPITPPVPQPESDFYWEKCKAHELWLRHCKACDKSYFYPRNICPNCFSRDTDWVPDQRPWQSLQLRHSSPGAGPGFPGHGALRGGHGGAGGRGNYAHQPGGSGAGPRQHQGGHARGGGVPRPGREDQLAQVQAGLAPHPNPSPMGRGALVCISVRVTLRQAQGERISFPAHGEPVELQAT